MNSPLYQLLKRIGPASTPTLAKQLRRETGYVNRELQDLVKKGLVEKLENEEIRQNVLLAKGKAQTVTKVNRWQVTMTEERARVDMPERICAAILRDTVGHTGTGNFPRPRLVWNYPEQGEWHLGGSDIPHSNYVRTDQVEEPDGLSRLILGMKPDKLRATLVLACKRASGDRDFLQEIKNMVLRIDINEVYDDGA